MSKCPLYGKCTIDATLLASVGAEDKDAERYKYDYVICKGKGNPPDQWTNCLKYDPVEAAVSEESTSSRKMILLNLFLGWLGVHRFYVGKRISGFLYVITFGVVGLGVAVDMVLIATGKFDSSVDNATDGEKIFCWAIAILIFLVWILVGSQ